MRKFWIPLGIVLVDQVAKYVVLQTMYRGQSIPVLGDWFKLTYTENPGMAFGIQLGHPSVVTILAIVATLLILYYMIQVGRTAYAPYRVSLALVLGGAFGNIIDRVFYGKLLYDEPLFLGRVVDFIHFDVCHCLVPSWVPGIGSHYISLFPIWNVADMAIVAGVIGIVVFQKAFHDRLAASHAAESARDEADHGEGQTSDGTAQHGAEAGPVEAPGAGSAEAGTVDSGAGSADAGLPGTVRPSAGDPGAPDADGVREST